MKTWAAMLVATAATSAMMLTPGTASAAGFPVKLNVKSVPTVDVQTQAESIEIVVNGGPPHCIAVTDPNTYDAGFSVNVGDKLTYNWRLFTQCAVPFGNYQPVRIAVTNPAPLKNFWIEVTDKSGKP